MKLAIGMVAESQVWEQVFRQEGVPFARVDLLGGSISDVCSMLVVNRLLQNSEREVVERYLHQGGAVLGYAHYLLEVAGTNCARERIDYLVSDGDAIFSDIHILDLGVIGALPREANLLRTQANHFGMFAGPLGGGHAVLLPFDVGSVLTDVRTASKCFYSKLDRLPSERVSLVSKGEVLHLLHRAFEYLHHVRRLPYVHLWYFPDGQENLFAFRIDTDGAPQSDVDELYHIARGNEVSLSWFLDVKSHEAWLKHFATLVDQEIGAHCYEHKTFPTYNDNLSNISRAVREIEEIGLKPGGFAAPYGIWNEELGRAIDEVGFLYSSEFSCAYDTFPLYPQTERAQFRTLQIPIHSICIGSLMKVGYSSGQMMEYYHAVIAQKLSRAEPLFFYHHPTHRHWDVVEFIFRSMRQRGINNVTLGEYARWWKIRQQEECSLTLEDELLSVVRPKGGKESSSEELSLHITREAGEEVLVPIGKRIDLKGLEWRSVERSSPPPQDIRRTREFDPRSMLGEIYNTVVRKFR